MYFFRTNKALHHPSFHLRRRERLLKLCKEGDFVFWIHKCSRNKNHTLKRLTVRKRKTEVDFNLRIRQTGAVGHCGTTTGQTSERSGPASLRPRLPRSPKLRPEEGGACLRPARGTRNFSAWGESRAMQFWDCGEAGSEPNAGLEAHPPPWPAPRASRAGGAQAARRGRHHVRRLWGGRHKEPAALEAQDGAAEQQDKAG